MDSFAGMLAVGGKTNSIKNVDKVVEAVLKNPSTFEDLYQCLFHEDAWVRMRAVDAIEKICRLRSKWLVPYIDRFSTDGLLKSTQPSIQWHLAQIYKQVSLSQIQRSQVISWLVNLLTTTEVDWIVSTNVMKTLEYFTNEGFFDQTEFVKLVSVQMQHKSKSVVNKATKLYECYKAAGI